MMFSSTPWAPRVHRCCQLANESGGARFITSFIKCHVSCRPSLGAQWHYAFARTGIISSSQQLLLQQFTILQDNSRRLYSGNSGARYNQVRYDECNDIDEVLRLATQNLHDKFPSAAVWNVLSRMMARRNKHAVSGGVTTRDKALHALLQHTMNKMGENKPKGLTTITLSMAKITKNVQQAKQQRRMNVYQQSFDKVLVGNKEIIFNHCAKLANGVMGSFDARYLSNLAYAYALLRQNPMVDDSRTLLDSIADRSIGCIGMFNPHDISNLVWAYATVNLQHPHLFKIIGDLIAQFDDLHSFKPQALGNIVWAYITANQEHDEMFRKIGHHITRVDDLRLFTPQDLANIAWAFATVNQQDDAMFGKIGDFISGLGDLRPFKPQELANTAWAFATANQHHNAMFRKIGNHISDVEDLRLFNSQDLANTVWAFAIANQHHDEMHGKIGDYIAGADDLRPFKPQHLANIAWAFATAHQHHDVMYGKIGDHIAEVGDLSLFNSQDLANIAWAFATANQQHDAMFRKIGDHIARVDDLRPFKPQHLANILWAYATANQQHDPMFGRIGDHIAEVGDLSLFNPQNIANIVWAYATANQQHDAMFRKIGDQIAEEGDLRQFEPQNISNIVWAYATANQQHDAMFRKIGDHIAEDCDLRPFKPQELANIAWAYAVVDVDLPTLFNDNFLYEILDRKCDFAASGLMQLYQWHLWRAYEKANNGLSSELKDPCLKTGKNSNHGLPEAFREQCYKAFIASVTTISRLQKDVVSELDSMGFNPIEEYIAPSGYSIDALIQVDDKPIGIEVDGPSHFIEQKPTARTLLKRRQVAAADKIPLVSVPYWEWNELGKDQEKRQQYLWSLLRSKDAKQTNNIVMRDVSPDAKQFELESENLKCLTVPELKDILRSKGLKVSGRKVDLIDRIRVCK